MQGAAKVGAKGVGCVFAHGGGEDDFLRRRCGRSEKCEIENGKSEEENERVCCLHVRNFYRTMKKKAHGLFWTEKDCGVPAVSVPKTS